MLWVLHSNRDNKQEVIQWTEVAVTDVSVKFFLCSDILFHGSNWRLVTQVVQQLLMFGGDSGESLEVYHSLGQVRVGVSKPAKNVTRAWRRENLKWKPSGGGYTELKGVHEKYNNLQLLVLMLFQNMLLQSLGEMGVMSLWYHTHIFMRGK